MLGVASARRGWVAAGIGILGLVLAEHPAGAQQQASRPEPPFCGSLPSSTVPSGRLAVLARGFNLTGWLDGAAIRRPEHAVLVSLRRRGFTHIRLPVTPERLMEVFSEPREVARQAAELDVAIDTLIAIGFGVSLDLHPGDRLSRLHVADPGRAFELIRTLWASLARRYAGRATDHLFFEVLNEPSVDRKIWDDQGPRLIEAIRREAPDHTIIYGPANFQRIDALVELAPLSQPNVVYAVHFYDPMVFTHQGLDWSDDPLRHLQAVPFPARLSDPAVVGLLEKLDRDGKGAAAALVRRQLGEPWDGERIAAAFASAAAWAKWHQRPVIVNEFGVLGWKAAVEDRVRWLAAVRRSAERHCIGWTHWEYADGFGFVRRIGGKELPDETLVGALLGPP
jgi:endoglucanase